MTRPGAPACDLLPRPRSLCAWRSHGQPQAAGRCSLFPASLYHTACSRCPTTLHRPDQTSRRSLSGFQNQSDCRPAAPCPSPLPSPLSLKGEGHGRLTAACKANHPKAAAHETLRFLLAQSNVALAGWVDVARPRAQRGGIAGTQPARSWPPALSPSETSPIRRRTGSSRPEGVTQCWQGCFQDAPPRPRLSSMSQC